MIQPEKKPPQGSSSRTVVIVAVAVLIIVAIAGIVLAGRKAPTEPVVTATPPSLPVTPASGTAPAASAAADEIPKDVKFAAGSDKLPANANEGIARFAESVRSSASSVRLSARYLTGENKAKDLELAKARTGAIRHALEADGITGGKMQVELIEMPAGTLTEDAGSRVDLTLR